ncbi:MAG: iron chelate uptake ABC transporter family permease subunit [Desulfovibrio sp.]|nr:iron chelate uptake ABC transporter family permease subunit [Desulfovibrio sp.]
MSAVCACSFGPLDIPSSAVFRTIFSLFTDIGLPDLLETGSAQGLGGVLDARALRLVVLEIRLPRVILAMAAGAGLALSGAVFQAVLRNPLADPFTLGVSGGAAFGAALAISLGLTGAFHGFGLPLIAFVFAALALGCVLMLGRIGGGLRPESLVLGGVVVSAFLAALIALVKALDESSVTGIVFWIMGSFQGRGWRDIVLLLPGFLLGSFPVLLCARQADMLGLGDNEARQMGLNASRLRLLLLLCAGAVTASCVAVSGIIGFVGLVVPHLVRMVLGAEHRRVFPASILCGALLLLWSDTAARTLPPGGVELPVGVITALFGGPFFCVILGKKQGRAVGRREERADAEVLPRAPGLAEAGRWAEGGEICCLGLSFAYKSGSPPVLDEVSLRIRPGEFAGLLGPNGSGKSTLLLCISGLLKGRTGKVLVSGADITALPERKRALLVSCLPQKPEFIPPLSAFSLALMGRYAHIPFLGAYGAGDRGIAMAALAETGAAYLAGRYADSLSGGELQRVLMARTLAQDATVLLLDEATAGLDPAFARSLPEALALRNKRTGLTVLAAMHDLNLAALFCDRLIFLKEGKILADGPTPEVFNAQTLRAVFACDFHVINHPRLDRPQVLL